MALPTPDALLDPFSNCLKSHFNSLTHQFPEIGKPGMAPILLGAAGAMLAPAIKVLDFIPPSADTVPDIQELLTNLPKIIVDGFTGSAVGLPGINFSILGINVKVGDVTLPESDFGPEALINLIKGVITAPFDIFKGILESLIKLSPKFPDLKMIIDILSKAFSSLGFPADVIEGFVKCLANVFMSVIDAIKP
jgi:hypothetical protein